ncbi:MAG: hypothetical protein K2K52_00485, partial [Paramuribaculum sp.]|nr:hypothetical protein [Paramuribaculum sp.]
SSTSLKDGDDVLGRHTKVKVVKNKVAPPFKRAEFDIMFGEGISRSSEIIDLGVDLDIIQKSGAWFSYDGSKLAQGREAAKKVIQDNPELAEELEEKIMAALKEGAKTKPAKGSKSKSAEKPESKSQEDSELDDLDDMDFDTEIPDDFSIEEDAQE